MDPFQRERSASLQRMSISRSHSQSPHAPIHKNLPGNTSNINNSTTAPSFSGTSNNQTNIASNNNINPALLFTNHDSFSSQDTPPQFNDLLSLNSGLTRQQQQERLGNTFDLNQTQDTIQAFNQVAQQPLQSTSASFGASSDLGAFGNNNSFNSSLVVDSFLLSSHQDLNSANGDLNTLGNMATMHQASPQPPHLLHPQPHIASLSSPHMSSQFGDSYGPPSYPHDNNSLVPSNVSYQQQGSQDWNLYQHPRTPSVHSDISSAQSPYFESLGSHSPMPTNNNLFQAPVDVPDFANFTLRDTRQLIPGQPQISPGHSVHGSPYLGAQHMPAFTGQENLGLAINGNMYQVQGQHIYPDPSAEPFPSIEVQDYNQMSPPPAINIIGAPDTSSSRPPSLNGECFGMPLTVPNRRRGRAVSDTTHLNPSAHSRCVSPSNRDRSPSLGTKLAVPSLPSQRHRSLSPGITKRRQSTPATTNSAKMRELALQAFNPDTSPPNSDSNLSNGGSQSDRSSGGKRSQKHPSTFHCHLCSKSFTRAYNLRSHLRTHTDERPFVCTICGKAFARQHDRKRHESLHSGEKKFVCKGELGENRHWGCGRGFARADALGRHFRSEAGRGCIKPLLDEEARDRQIAAQEAHSLNTMNGGSGGVVPQYQAQVMVDPNVMPLPAALLQMYPTLAEMWYNMPPGIPGEMEEGEMDFSGMEESDQGEMEFGWEDDEGMQQQMGLNGNGTGMNGGMNGNGLNGNGVGMNGMAHQGSYGGW